MTTWPADSVERRKIADLVPYARNSRTHSEAQIAQIAESIKEWGWTIPVLIDPEGGIIAGHGRVMAAELLKIDEVPTMTAVGWSEAQKRAYVIADNKLALNAGWDDDALKDEINALTDMDADISLIGFSNGELQNLFLERDFGATIAADEWVGMPDYVDQDPCYRKIIVSFDTEEDVQAFVALMDQEITDKTKSMWFPAKANRDLKSKVWDGDE